MKKQNDVKILIDSRRKHLGISCEELAIASVGSKSTWKLRMSNPGQLKLIEAQKIFEMLDFTKDLKEQFYETVEEVVNGKGI